MIKDRYQSAIHCFIEAHDIQISIIGSHHMFVAGTSFSIRRMYYKTRKADQAKEVLESSIATRIEKLGEKSQLVGISMQYIGLVYQALKYYLMKLLMHFQEQGGVC